MWPCEFVIPLKKLLRTSASAPLRSKNGVDGGLGLRGVAPGGVSSTSPTTLIIGWKRRSRVERWTHNHMPMAPLGP
jgi:hypothetical protein